MTTLVDPELDHLANLGPEHETSWLRRLVGEVMELGCTGVPEKLREFRGGRLGDLIAELRLAKATTTLTGAPAQFDVGDAPDFRFTAGSATCLVDVVHKSISSPMSLLLHSTPSELAGLANLSPHHAWKLAALNLSRALETLPVDIQPWFDSTLLQHCADYASRAAQEQLCSEVVDWFASELPNAVTNGVAVLKHPRNLAHFEIGLVDCAPGRIKGSGWLNTSVLVDGWLRHDIERKAKKAKERLALGGDCYFAGLVVDEAFSSSGRHLLTTLLGPSISECITPPNHHRSFRSVPLSGLPVYDVARRRGRGELLDRAKFDRGMNDLYKFLPGLYFDADCAFLTGTLALYYTDTFQFVPNPFSSTDLERVIPTFPKQLDPEDQSPSPT